MRSRLARLGGVAVGLLALLGGLTPPAHATTVLDAVFVGTVILASPLGYPCTPVGDISLCPQAKTNADDNITTVTPPNILPGDVNTTLLHLVTWAGLTQSPLTLPGATPVPNPTHWPDFHHNKTTIVAVNQTACQDVAVNVTKLTKAPTHAGACTFGLTANPLGNTVAGNCGLSSGQVRVTFTDFLGQQFTIDVHFVAIAGELIVEGHSTKVTGGQTGLVVGVVNATPPLPGGTESCANKTATTFQLEGTVTAAG
jgi:hypothetical protein